MPTNVSEFGGVCYAAAYFVQGSRLIVVGTHRSDRAGVREWLAAAGHPRSGAYLTPAPGTAPGFYAKPYVADVYYRIDPETRAAEWDGQSRFGDPRPVTEQDGFRGSASSEVIGESARPAPAVGPHPAATAGRRSDSQHKGNAVRYMGIGLVLMGVVIAMFACVGLVARPDGTAVTGFLLTIAAGSAVAGAAVVRFGGRGYSRSEPAAA